MIDYKWEFLVIIVLFLHIGDVCTAGLGGYTLKHLPPDPTFKAANTQADDNGLTPFYDMVRTFIGLVLPDVTQVIDDLVGVLTKGLDLNYIIEIVKSQLIGFAVVLGIGILFVIIFPIVGLCFCCCRLCCKCCCDKPEVEDPSASCKRKVYGVFLFVFIAVTGAGNICTYVTNERISTALDEISTNTQNNIDDIGTFVNHTLDSVKNSTSTVKKQVKTIQENFDRAKTAVDNVLDDTKIKDAISKQSLTLFKVDSISGLQSDIDNLKRVKTDMENSYQTLASSLPNPTTPLPFPLIPTGLDDISSKATSGLKSTLDNMLKSKMTTITSKTAEVKTKLSEAQTKVHSAVSQLTDSVKKGGSLNLDGIKGQVRDTVQMVTPYDKYRWYGGVGCAGVVSLIVGLSFFGLCVGSLGGCGGRGLPTEKGCVANSGGRMLIASDVFLFLFGSLLMLLTTVLFVPGSVLERYICQPLTDPELRVFDKLVGEFFSIDAYLTYQTDHVPTVGKLLKNCKANQAVYTAFGLEFLVNTIGISDMEKTINETKIKIKVDMEKAIADQIKSGQTSSATLLPPALKTSLDTLSNVITQQVIDDLNKKISDLEKAAEALHKNPPELVQMKASVLQLQQLKTKLPTSVQKVKTELDQASKKLQNATAVKQIVISFIDDMVKIVDTFFAFTKHSILHEMGKCGPIYNVYYSIINVSLCKYTVDSLNGFWCSIGWCILFCLPMAVFGTKLSNQMRDVEYEIEDMKSSNGELSSADLRKSRNKVGHMDSKV